MKKTNTIRIMCSIMILVAASFLGAIPENQIIPFAIPFAMQASPDGEVVVGYAGAGEGAYYWTEEAGVVELGPNDANAISANYLIAGTKLIEAEQGPRATAGYWNLDGEFTEIGNFPGAEPTEDGYYSDALAISADGNTIGGMGWTGPWTANAMKWTAAGGMINLRESDEASRVNSLSADGSIAVGWVESDWTRYPTYWDSNNVQHIISQEDDGEAMAISPNGQHITGYIYEDGFIYTNNEMFTFAQEGMGWTTIPAFVNDSGLVVGIIRNFFQNAQEGFLYNQTMGLVSANDYFAERGVVMPADFSVHAISWVSEDATTFIGWGGGMPSQGFIVKLSESAYITGTVTAENNGDVTLATISNGQVSTNPNADGIYSLTVAPGTHTLTATMPGYYVEMSDDVETVAGETTNNINFELEAIIDLATIQGTVTISGGSGNLSQVLIQAGEFVTHPNSAGEYVLLVDADSYTVMVTLPGFFTLEEEVTIVAGEVLELDFEIISLDALNELVINIEGVNVDYAKTKIFVNHHSYGGNYFTPNAAGVLELGLVYEDDLTISVYAPGFVAASQAGIATSPYVITTVDFVMEKVYNAPRNPLCDTASFIEWDAPYTINSYVDDFESYNTGSHIAMNNPMWLTIGGPSGSIVDPIVAFNPNINNGQYLEISSANDVVVDLGDVLNMEHSVTSGRYEINFDVMVPAGYAGHYNIIRSLENLEFSLEVFFREDGTLQLHHSADVYQTITYNHDEWINFKHVVDLTNDAASLHINNEEAAMWLFTANAYEGGFGENKLDIINFSGDSEPTTAEVCMFYIDNFAFSEIDDFGADAYLVYRDGTLITPSPLSNLTFTDVALADGTYHYGVTALYDAVESAPATLTVIIVDGTSNDDNEANLVTTLQGNYPNPFNPETTISFTTQKDNLVTLDVYNVKGQKVKTLINEHRTAGQHSVVWNGTDDNNRKVSSGVYFYRMRNGKFSSTKKMILMK